MPRKPPMDPELREETHRVGGRRTKKATVTEALREDIMRRKQRRVLDLFGTVEYDADYDPEEQRGKP